MPIEPEYSVANNAAMNFYDYIPTDSTVYDTKKAKKSLLQDTSPVNVGYYSVADINRVSEIEPVYAQLINDLLSDGFIGDFEKKITEVQSMYQVASVDDTEVQSMYASVDDIVYLPANKFSTSGSQPLYAMGTTDASPKVFFTITDTSYFFKSQVICTVIHLCFQKWRLYELR